MAVIDSLNTAKTNYATILATESLNPKPTYNLDGKSVAWQEYQAWLVKTIADLTRLINAEAPYESRSQAR